MKISRIIIFGDFDGVTHSLSHIPKEDIIAIVGAYLRTKDIPKLKNLANNNNIPFFTQPKFGSNEYKNFIQKIEQLKSDLIFINSYSMILRDDILKTARNGAINLHSSLLPKNRGANPIQWAIINDQKETGVTLHVVDYGLDTGPIIAQKAVPIEFTDTWITVRDKIFKASNQLLEENLKNILSGSYISSPQRHNDATVGPRRYPEDGEFSWNESVISIYNKIRALIPPLPPAYFKHSTGQKVYYETFSSIYEIIEIKSKQNKNLKSEGFFADFILDLTLHHHKKFKNLANHNKLGSRNLGTLTFSFKKKSSFEEEVLGQIFNINWHTRVAEIQVCSIRENKVKSDFLKLIIEWITDFAVTELNLDTLYVNLGAPREYQRISFYRSGYINDSDGKGLVSNSFKKVSYEH